MSRSLYERWAAAAAQRPGEIALVETQSGRRWTFRQLRAEAEAGDAETAPVIFPGGHHAGFVLEVLRAWRSGRAACPLEAGQRAPGFGPVPDRFAHLKLTSASTGAAKCIGFTAEQLAADPENIVTTMGLRPDWPNLACISLAHSYGFSNLVLPLLLHGIPLVIVPAPLPEMVRAAAREFAGVTLAAVPALWRSWHEARSIPDNARLAISAGAPLPPGLEREIFQDNGLKVHNFYGSSECGGIAYDRSMVPRQEGGDAGTALEGVSLSLSAAGTLVVESAAVGEGYWPEPQPELRAPRFETSDLAELHGGKVILRGRVSDLINVAGRKAVPETIEAALRAHPAVAECVVFGLGDSARERSETIVACVHARQELTPAGLARFLSERLPAWQIPRRWWFTRDLAPNSRGKLSRAEWRQRFLEARTGGAAAAAFSDGRTSG